MRYPLLVDPRVIILLLNVREQDVVFWDIMHIRAVVYVVVFTTSVASDSSKLVVLV